MSRWGCTREELRAKLSPTAFAELVAAFGGRVLRVPAPRFADQLARRRQLVAALDRGDTYREAAEQVGVSLSTAAREAKRST